jgi:hypothetical protein
MTLSTHAVDCTNERAGAGMAGRLEGRTAIILGGASSRRSCITGTTCVLDGGQILPEARL